MIYFVRHGVTDWNENIDSEGRHAPRCQGRADIPLNENGRKQAEELAPKLKDIKFDKVICSPLSRAKETCKIILGSLDGVVIDNRVIERDFGEFEGLTRYEFDFEAFCDHTLAQAFEHAETVHDIEKRVYALLDELKQTPNDNVLIVAHGGVGSILITYFDGKPDNGDYSNFVIPHGEPLVRQFK